MSVDNTAKLCLVHQHDSDVRANRTSELKEGTGLPGLTDGFMIQ